MDFDQLEIFLEVARLSSFSRAAEKRFRRPARHLLPRRTFLFDHGHWP